MRFRSFSVWNKKYRIIAYSEPEALGSSYVLFQAAIHHLLRGAEEKYKNT
jgi:hypothetical protein